tara:strand:- start:308 stop:484 length:177 start_codon:yes stop_codon:yes gene_type:complete
MIISVKKQYDPLTNTFSSYELIEENQLVKSVPLDEANTDYQAIQQWISEGNTVIDNGE